ncbi:MAG: FAD-binding protein, partial [Candidatus Woesearchaeota archaeon]
MKYDAIIIGAGPAGLFAAHTLKDKKIAIIEQGMTAAERVKAGSSYKNGFSNGMCGVGGAGLFSDGKLVFTHKHGKTDLTQFLPEHSAKQLIIEVEQIFGQYGMDGEIFPKDKQKAAYYYKTALQHGLHLMLLKYKHMGSDELPRMIGNMQKSLEKEGVEFQTQTKAEEFIIENRQIVGLRTDQGDFECENLIVAPGRAGSKWLYNEAQKLNLGVEFGPVEVGVRVEVPSEIMEEITDTLYDPTFFLNSKAHDDVVRTFCTNPNGFVIQENYEDFICVNGHASKSNKSDNTNFALLSRVSLTKPLTDTHSYGVSIARLTTTLGGGKPILQRYGDLI